MAKRPLATIQMENGARIVVELYPEQAPNTVNSFIWLAKQGCYDGHEIERIVPGWVLDVSYTAFGKNICKYLIPNESRCEGVNNTLRMELGTIGMGGYAQDEISGGEFFFPFAYSDKLDGRYPGFGRVVKGIEEIKRLEKVETVPVKLQGELQFEINRPVAPEKIRFVFVETFGEQYPEPIRLTGHTLPEYWQ